MSLSAHIFCRVIDNYGDIGVAYRLARQLVSEHNWRVILWVDNLVALSRLLGEPLRGLDICHWAEPFPKRIERGDVVIEAFACRVPDSVLQSMVGTGVVWLNLEYLSAEKWVEGSHTLPSLHPTLPLTQHFFFPGFTPRTGGLLREAGLLQQRAKFVRSNPKPADELWISLFCYPTAPVAAWLPVLEKDSHKTRLMVPEGVASEALNAFFGGSLKAGQNVSRGNLSVNILPFVPQDEFDHVLWQADFNIVRGEDSLVRGLWARKPLLWHIYPQQEAAHLPKLQAFLEVYGQELTSAKAKMLANMHHLWNVSPGDWPASWPQLRGQLAGLSGAAAKVAARLAQQPDLAQQLVHFVTALARKQTEG